MIFETILGYKASWRIMELLAETPTKPVSRTDIKKYTGLGNEAVNSALRRFAIAEIVVKEKKGKKESYYLNLSNDFIKRIVELIKEERHHLKNISFDVVMILSEFTRKLLEKTGFVNKIFVFGSVAKGTARADSDIDVAVITAKKDIKQELIATKITDELLEKFKRPIQIHYFTNDEFKTSSSSLIEEIKNDGIDIFSFNKNIKWNYHKQ